MWARALACALLVLACTSELPRPPYVQQPTSALFEVSFPPPPARVELVPKQPTEGAVWIDGEWAWRRRRWAWTPGRWLIPPPGAAYSPWTAVRDADGTLYYAQGTWRNARKDEIPEPKALAYGQATSGPVVDPEGEIEPTGRNVDPNRPAPWLDAGRD